MSEEIARGEAPPTAVVQSEGRTVATDTPQVSEAPKHVEDQAVEPQSFVWLANGDVLRVNDADLPGHAGQNAVHGHWVKDGKQYLIVAVYPAEENVKG